MYRVCLAVVVNYFTPGGFKNFRWNVVTSITVLKPVILIHQWITTINTDRPMHQSYETVHWAILNLQYFKATFRTHKITLWSSVVFCLRFYIQISIFSKLSTNVHVVVLYNLHTLHRLHLFSFIFLFLYSSVMKMILRKTLITTKNKLVSKEEDPKQTLPSPFLRTQKPLFYGCAG